MRKIALSLLALPMACSSSDATEGAGGGVSVQLQAGQLDAPLDAAPSPDGKTAYFITDGATKSALFSIHDGATTELATFDHAQTLVVAPDGKQIFVGQASHGIIAVDVETRTTSAVPGSDGYSVTHLDIAGDLVIAGTDSGGSAGVWTLPTTGGTAKRVVGALPETPIGVLSLGGGKYAVAYESGKVVQASANGSDPLVEGATLGEPAGLALSPSDGSLMISSYSKAGTAQVILVDLATRSTSVFNEVIGQNTGAAGLHCAPEEPVCVWAGFNKSKGGAGSVYLLEFQ